MTLKQVRNYLNIELRGELMKSSQAEQFEAILKEQQKILERLAIQALITTKVTKIKTLKQNSTAELAELASAMDHQTTQVLPESLAGALQGKTAQAAKSYLGAIKCPKLVTPLQEVGDETN